MEIRCIGQYVGLLLATSAWWACQSQPPDRQAGQPAAPAPSQPEGRPATKPLASFTGYHRYTGTVGTLPVVLELTIHTDSAGHATDYAGRYFYLMHAGQLLLSGRAKPHEPLYLSEAEEDAPTSSGYWQAEQPAGPRLTGTWFSARGQRLPFELHEDYAGAVRYELINEAATGEPCHPEPDAEGQPMSWDGNVASVSKTYLHLLGPDTLRPALRRLQCPGPVARREALAAEAASEENSCTEEDLSCEVAFNGFGLLSLSQVQNYYGFGAAHPSHSYSGVTYDLRTGRVLTVADLFRPGTDSLLRQLLSRHLLRTAEREGLSAAEAYNWAPPELAPMPRGGAYLTAAGLYFGYDDYEVAGYSAGNIGVLLPYRELRPLLRPESAVARMLRARGLW